MIAKTQYQAYAAATQTVARTRQIVMLYDGAIRFLQHAKEAIVENRIEDRFRLLTKVSEVLMGLQGCLDFDKGGDIAKMLYNFYSMIDGRVFAVQRTNSVDACNEIIAELKQMRDVWHEIDQGSLGEAAPPAAPVMAASALAGGADQSVVLSA